MVLATVEQPPLVFGWPEFAWFMAANIIIFYICFGRLWIDIKRWTGR